MLYTHFPRLLTLLSLGPFYYTEAFAYVNIARLAAPLRIAFALSSTPWIQQNILDRIMTDSATKQDKNKP